MYNEEGEAIWERSLDAFGKVQEGSHKGCPFMYQGQYYDEEIELAYNRFRYYDPEEGRYISKDPIGLLGGNPNFYAYVHDSNNWVDPKGLNSVPPIRESDLTGGIHAPDATLDQAKSRASDPRNASAQGQWSSKKAVENAAKKYDSSLGGVQVVDIDSGDGRVVHGRVGSYPPGASSHLVVPATRAIIIPTNDGLHLFPIDETHKQYNSHYRKNSYK